MFRLFNFRFFSVIFSCANYKFKLYGRYFKSNNIANKVIKKTLNLCNLCFISLRDSSASLIDVFSEAHI